MTAILDMKSKKKIRKRARENTNPLVQLHKIRRDSSVEKKQAIQTLSKMLKMPAMTVLPFHKEL